MNTLSMMTMIEQHEEQARRLNRRSATPTLRAVRQFVGAVLLAVGSIAAVRSFDPFQLTLAHGLSWTVAIVGAATLALQPRDGAPGDAR